MKFIGKVTGLGGNYKDGLEWTEAHINKSKGIGLPFEVGKRVRIILIINSKKYEAGLRSTERNSYVWICPDIKDQNGNKETLAQVFKDAGIKKDQSVELEVSGTTIELKPLGLVSI